MNCLIEPGLLSLNGLKASDALIAHAVMQSLSKHVREMRTAVAKFPATGAFIEKINKDLSVCPINTPPIKQEFGRYVREILARTSQPSLSPTGVEGTEIAPEIISAWVSDELKHLWVDTINSAISEFLASNNDTATSNKLFVAIRELAATPKTVRVANSKLGDLLEHATGEWTLQVLSGELDYRLENEIDKPGIWTKDMDLLVKAYAKQKSYKLRSGTTMRQFRFESSAQRAIEREDNDGYRDDLVGVLTRMVYNCLEPRDNDEKIQVNPRERRLYVRKMKPPIRLHYYFDGDVVVYTSYSYDHDKGL